MTLTRTDCADWPGSVLVALANAIHFQAPAWRGLK